MKDVFTDIYKTNGWGSDESVSGRGSTMDQTAVVRELLPGLLDRLQVDEILDIPCGDYGWFQHINFSRDIAYIGADIVNDLVRANIEKYGQNAWRQFRTLDITRDDLPKADLVLVRDLLGHFSNRDVQNALRNIKRSGIRYLLATTFPGRETTGDIVTGEWRPIDLAHYWGLGQPDALIVEKCTDGDGAFSDKCLGLWDLRDLR